MRISDKIVLDQERMLTGGFYSEIELGYDGSIAQEKGGRPFDVLGLREIQLSTRDILDKTAASRAQLTTREWKDLILRNIGLEPAALSDRAQDTTLLRMIPFVERNYNLIGLGPRGTGKSDLFQQVSPYAHLVSGGKATVARMFVNMANGHCTIRCFWVKPRLISIFLPDGDLKRDPVEVAWSDVCRLVASQDHSPVVVDGAAGASDE